MAKIKGFDEMELHDLLDDALKAKRDSLKILFAEVVREGTCSWRQKVKVAWAKDGDYSTSLSSTEWAMVGRVGIGLGLWLMSQGTQLGKRRRSRKKSFLSSLTRMGQRFSLNQGVEWKPYF